MLLTLNKETDANQKERAALENKVMAMLYWLQEQVEELRSDLALSKRAMSNGGCKAFETPKFKRHIDIEWESCTINTGKASKGKSKELSTLVLEMPNMTEKDSFFKFMDDLQPWTEQELQRRGV
ncbi:hypothetical protein AMTR_s00136p00064370 [Amborella trichopoda]|uniref:Uncharacterized protein n=1 Tax=Amborella trichopoda TaxID=13333 RepID=W1NEW2_AMBTC|nr:hypothetical protein AMTR_s00136p00064370 [Amborella trichopoda]